jgi:drug/metabolite transporter (DMT)-like permease
MLLGTAMLTVQDAVSKWLIGDFHAGEILFYRGLWAYLPIVAFMWYERRGRIGWSSFRSRQPFVNILRASLNTGAGFAVISSYAYLPLADAMTITFSSPLLVTLLSIPMLGERVGWRRWLAAVVGFVGVVFIARPAGQVAAWVVWLPILAAVLLAFRDILTRRLGAVDSTSVILFFTVTVSVVAGLMAMVVFGASWPSYRAWMVFAVMGLVNGIAHYLIIKAFSLANASTLAPLRYTSLVWAGIIGFWVWGDVPDSWALVGASLIVGSGLYILARERRSVTVHDAKQTQDRR